MQFGERKASLQVGSCTYKKNTLIQFMLLANGLSIVHGNHI
jgi:hypothetical protein